MTGIRIRTASPDGYEPDADDLARVADVDGLHLVIGVDYDTVTIGGVGMKWRLPAEAAEQFAALFVRACWLANTQARQRAELEREDILDAQRKEACGD